jgi:hypothetical protein
MEQIYLYLHSFLKEDSRPWNNIHPILKKAETYLSVKPQETQALFARTRL